MYEIIQVPYIYQAEILQKYGRKKKMVNILDYIYVEVLLDDNFIAYDLSQDSHQQILISQAKKGFYIKHFSKNHLSYDNNPLSFYNSFVKMRKYLEDVFSNNISQYNLESYNNILPLNYVNGINCLMDKNKIKFIFSDNQSIEKQKCLEYMKKYLYTNNSVLKKEEYLFISIEFFHPKHNNIMDIIIKPMLYNENIINKNKNFLFSYDDYDNAMFFLKNAINIFNNVYQWQADELNFLHSLPYLSLSDNNKKVSLMHNIKIFERAYQNIYKETLLCEHYDEDSLHDFIQKMPDDNQFIAIKELSKLYYKCLNSYNHRCLDRNNKK